MEGLRYRHVTIVKLQIIFEEEEGRLREEKKKTSEKNSNVGGKASTYAIRSECDEEKKEFIRKQR